MGFEWKESVPPPLPNPALCHYGVWGADEVGEGANHPDSQDRHRGLCELAHSASFYRELGNEAWEWLLEGHTAWRELGSKTQPISASSAINQMSLIHGGPGVNGQGLQASLASWGPCDLGKCT